MGERRIDLQAGFLPYSDGSGFAVSVTIRQYAAGDDPEIWIETVGGVKASDWPEIVTGVNQLLSAIPSPPRGAGE